MTSLTDVYEGRAGRVASRRQQLLGTGLFCAGTAMVVVAIGLATTGLSYRTLGELVAREWAGVLAGVGIQGILLGVTVVLPASRRVRAASVIGSAVAVLGVTLFRYAYPYQWVQNAPLLALATTAVYCFGVVTTFWCLFAALATFKTRNDPGGTARMKVTEEGTIRLVEEARSTGGLGGVGLFGREPDGAVETQTNVESGQTAAGPAAAVSDGGSTGFDDGGEVLSNEASAASPTQPPTTDGPKSTANGTDPAQHRRTEPDKYCGNCRKFEYVSGEDEPVPYCKFHGDAMDDMEPCPAWTKQ